MAFTYEFEPCGKYLLVRTRGIQAVLEDGIAYARAIAAHSIKHNLGRVLLDERHLRMHTSTIADFELVIGVLRERLHVSMQRMACVPHPQDLTKAQFFETAAQNRGLNFRLFEEVAAAQQWLEQD